MFFRMARSFTSRRRQQRRLEQQNGKDEQPEQGGQPEQQRRLEQQDGQPEQGDDVSPSSYLDLNQCNEV